MSVAKYAVDVVVACRDCIIVVRVLAEVREDIDDVFVGGVSELYVEVGRQRLPACCGCRKRSDVALGSGGKRRFAVVDFREKVSVGDGLVRLHVHLFPRVAVPLVEVASHQAVAGLPYVLHDVFAWQGVGEVGVLRYESRRGYFSAVYRDMTARCHFGAEGVDGYVLAADAVVSIEVKAEIIAVRQVVAVLLDGVLRVDRYALHGIEEEVFGDVYLAEEVGLAAVRLCLDELVRFEETFGGGDGLDGVGVKGGSGLGIDADDGHARVDNRESIFVVMLNLAIL